MNDYAKIAYEAFCGAYQKSLPLKPPYETLIQELKNGWEAAANAVLATHIGTVKEIHVFERK